MEAIDMRMHAYGLFWFSLAQPPAREITQFRLRFLQHLQWVVMGMHQITPSLMLVQTTSMVYLFIALCVAIKRGCGPHYTEKKAILDVMS